MKNDIYLGVPKLEKIQNQCVISAEFRVNEKTELIWFKVDKKYGFNYEIAQDAFLVCTLLSAMKKGGKFHIESPISPRLKTAIDKIQKIVLRWYPNVLSKVELIAESRNQDAPIQI
jgi:hypothetical protein